MTTLPPKTPSTTQNLPNTAHRRFPTTAAHKPSGAEEFLEFSSARRGGSHRRSVHDAIAFLEAPLPEECPWHGEFDSLDDERLLSMFSDDVSAAEALAPAPAGGMVKDEAEAQSEIKEDPQVAVSSTTSETVADPKRVRRILANRQSAQRSRVRKLKYISDLERSVTSLQSEVSALSPRVAFLDHQRLVLNVDNSALKQRIAALAQDKIFKDNHQESLKKEIERLRRVYHQQNLSKMNSNQSEEQELR